VRVGTAPQSPRRSSPAGARRPPCPMALSRPGPGVGPTARGPPRPCEPPLRLKTKERSSSRPPGRLDPPPGDRAYGSLARAALESRARQGESIVLSEDATVLWRFALPRAGWWRTAQRARLPTRPLRQRQSKRDASLNRPASGRSRSWSRLTSGGGSVSLGRSRMAPPTSSLKSCRTLLPRRGAPLSLTSWRPSAQLAQRS
jgi:hypothetical protein